MLGKRNYKRVAIITFILIACSGQLSSNIAFTENKGQITDQNRIVNNAVLFSASDNKLLYHFYSDHVSYQFQEVKEWVTAKLGKSEIETQVPSTYEINRLDINWINCNTNSTILKEGKSKDFINFYTSNNSSTNIYSYRSILYKNLYEGIDLKWYDNNGVMKYDFIVSAHSDYKLIQMKYDGAKNLFVDHEGNLVIEVPFGKITEAAPFVTQNNKRIKAKWVVNETIVTIQIDNFSSEHELIIDPAVRLWATYYGGTPTEIANAVATDAFYNVFLAGYTTATSTVIATVGAHQTTYSGGGGDGFLVKFDPFGNRLWATYYGGTGLELVFGCAIDQNTDDVYVCGQTSTNSGTLIASAGSHQTAYGLGSSDAFLIKFNSIGIRQWGTYYGGSGADIGYSCATDLSGNVYLSGNSNSSVANVISTAGGHQVTNGGSVDAFLVQFNSAGVRQWGTYYGGIGLEDGYSCSTDIAGNVFLCLASTSTLAALASAGAHQTVAGGGAGASDVVLVKFNSSGVRQWATFLGGSVSERAYSCCTDFSGNVCIAGIAFSTPGTIIATAGSHQSVGGGLQDAFLVKFNSAGVRQWGTFYGSTNNDYGYSCYADISNNIYLAGYVDANHAFVATGSGHQPSFGGGVFDAFLVQFNSAGVRQIATFYGGSNNETNPCVTTDGLGSAYLGGQTNSANNISTALSHQPVAGGGLDAYLVKFTPQLIPLPIYLVSFESQCKDSSEWLYWKTYSEEGNVSYTIQRSDDAVSWFDLEDIIVKGGKGSANNYSYKVPRDIKANYYRLRSNEIDLKQSFSDIIEASICNSDEQFFISLFPNPSSGNLYIQASEVIDSNLSITDVYGKVIKTVQVTYLGNNKYQFNVSDLPNGFYLLRVNANSEFHYIKFIKHS